MQFIPGSSHRTDHLLEHRKWFLCLDNTTGGTGCLGAGGNDIVYILPGADPCAVQHADLWIDCPDGLVDLGDGLSIVDRAFTDPDQIGRLDNNNVWSHPRA